MPEALRAASVVICVHDELFSQRTEDAVWLREAGVNDWIVITRDDPIRWTQAARRHRSLVLRSTQSRAQHSALTVVQVEILAALVRLAGGRFLH